MLFDKCTSGFDLVTHEGSKDLIRRNGILDFYLEQATGCGIHGGFPKLFGIHLTQTFVALFGDSTFGFLALPTNRITEMTDRLLFTAITLTTGNPHSSAYQTHQSITCLLQCGVIRAQNKISIKNTDLDIAMQ